MKSKKFGLILSCSLLVVLGLITWFAISEQKKPLDSSVTVSGLQARVQSDSQPVLARIGETDYYEIAPSNSFADLFTFDEWEYSSSSPSEPTWGEASSEKPLLSLEFQELWVVNFCSNGQVAVHNGYGSPGKKSYAYYTVPDGTADQVTKYLAQNGKSHEFGDGTIGLGSFVY